jgi:hypothetical protein
VGGQRCAARRRLVASNPWGLKTYTKVRAPRASLLVHWGVVFACLLCHFFLIQIVLHPRSLHAVQVATFQKPLLLPTRVGGSGRLLVTKHKHSIQVHEPHDLLAQPHWPRRWVARK